MKKDWKNQWRIQRCWKAKETEDENIMKDLQKKKEQNIKIKRDRENAKKKSMEM